MAQNSLDPVRQRAFGAILRNAVLSWQTGLTLLVTLVLFFGVQITNIPGWQNWFWLVLGGVAEGAFILSNLFDPNAATQAVSKAFDAQYDLSQIRSPVSRQRLQSALEYRRNMMTLAGRHQGAMRANLQQQTISDINDWIGHMYDLALHIDAFDNNDLVERDRKAVPQQIEKTQIRIKNEADPSVKADLEEQLKTLIQQRDNLDATVNSVKRAEIQLESTLSSLGTIYAQMSLLGTKEVDSSKAQRLRLEIKDEVSSLQDTISAMNEVQSQRLQLQ